MTSKSESNSPDTSNTLNPNIAKFEVSETESTMQMSAGLSALIQAASSHLRLLEVEGGSDHGQIALSTSLSEDDAFSEDRERQEAPVLTPTIDSEVDPTKQQSFPELLMALCLNPINRDVIAFLPDGKYYAIRPKEFSAEMMLLYFGVSSFDEFQELSEEWGFMRITKDHAECTDVEVFRHPHFIRGDWEKCSSIKLAESPTDSRMFAFPELVKIECATSDDSTGSNPGPSKRRLSPGFIARRESETSAGSQKQKLDSNEEISTGLCSRQHSEAAFEADDNGSTSVSYPRGFDYLRNEALSITAEKLKIRTDSENGVIRVPLVERGVKFATRTIVTDAIEALLRDRAHTMEIFLKHEDQLSRSSLPGVVPISKQLFSPRSPAETKDDC